MRRTLTVFSVLVGLAVLACTISGTGIDSGTTEEKPPACVAGGEPCPGCCVGTVCKKGDLALECGINAAKCVECASESICRHPFGGCTVDGTSRWRVWAYAADVLDRDGGWDPDGGLPDPFIALYCPNGATSPATQNATAMNTLHPRWSSSVGDCILDAKSLQTQGFGVAAFEDDGNPPVETLTTMSTVKVNEADFERGWMQASGGALEGVWFKLERQ